MATTCCAYRYPSLRVTAEVNASATTSATLKERVHTSSSGLRQSKHDVSRQCSRDALPALRTGYSRAIRGGSLGQKEHLGDSLRLLEQHASSAGWGYTRCPALKINAAKRINTGRSFALSSTLVVAKGNEDKVTALCQEILKWGAAKKMQKGSGVTAFDCNADPFETNTYHFWELYDSFQVMNDIRSSPEHTKFMDDVRPLLEQPVGLAAYEYKDGQIGHMLNPIGPKGEGGLDDATGQSGTKQQSAVIGQGLGEMEEDVGSKAWGLEKLLAKVRGESKDGGWSFKSLFGDTSKSKS